MCSKKNCAYTFLIFGLVFCVIALVCGFVIPKIIISILDERSCVNSKKDSNYEDLVKEKTDAIITKLYYWEITNKNEFLYHGQLPKLKERGPYVYKQNAQTINVKFNNSQRSWKTWRKCAKFDEDKSCFDCKEDDKITLLNLGYIATMKALGGDEQFALSYLSRTIKYILNKFNHSYVDLGNIQQTIWLSEFKSPGFAQWLHDTHPQLNQTNFTSVEMKGLYGVLGSNIEMFGSTMTNMTLKSECNDNSARYECGFLMHMTAQLKLQAQNKNNSNLLKLIEDRLCRQETNQTKCFRQINLLSYIHLYVNHVNSLTIKLFIEDKYDIVTTKTQKEIANGYRMKNIINPLTGREVEVPGMITVHKKENDALKYGKESTIYTCNAGDGKKHQWAAFDGKRYVTGIPGVTQDEAEVRGYSYILPRSKNTDKPCAFSHDLHYKSIEMFVSQMRMRLKLDYQSEETFYGLELKRFIPNKEQYLGHSLVKNGFMDGSTRLRMPSYFSLPHMLFTNITSPSSFNQHPDKGKHQHNMDIEPVSGLLARAFIRLQINIPIQPEIVKVSRVNGSFNISYMSHVNDTLYMKSIPVLWAAYGTELKKSDADILRKKVIGILGLACGILISLSIFSIIFVIVGIILYVLTVKANRISEMTTGLK